MITVTPGDQLVVRVYKWDAEALLKTAEIHYRELQAEGTEPPYFGVSVFASPVLTGEEDLEAVMTELREVTLRSMPGAKYLAFTTRTRLEEGGFELRLNPPPDQHYAVVLEDLSDARAERLASVFEQETRVKVRRAR
ncbi:MAG TPA: hypothetical protein PLZ93_00475 [Nocardioides sp.]|uniref:hypothetical protein n=1 Tax=uncultured Nocardioides sp. TaxID=198441 RepID=UPI000EECF799|nr:hypothetical protein [uncultured Nocardioides sp.]HCB05152.1 hypothetical protein [Nocardioides sp.]HRD63861.1 hypothetical protein [Nocardioides sp.]HRI94067.1 hypothetical protein [Nocardioides sp.]HRK44126.1 hypothetical protein [Nocardioides sp.]